MKSLRLFLAIELNDAIRKRLARLVERLDDGAKGVRWTTPDQCHLTIKFLGDVAQSDLPRVTETADRAVRGIRALEMHIRGVGCFPPNGPPRVIWAGVEEPEGTLARLRASCQSVFADLGFSPERRAFSPHITLARVRNPQRGRHLPECVVRVADFDAGAIDVDEITLFQSILSRDGAEYVPLSHHALNG
jgi:2'-5' RNA ligase